MVSYSPGLSIRPAHPPDTPVLFELVQALADYEELSHHVVGNAESLHNHLFCDRPYVEALVAEVDQRIVGFALFFYNYSTFLTKPGIYLEDLFVLPDYRRRGIGQAFLQTLAQLAVDRDLGRLEWSVLDWNEPAIRFYKTMGATVLPDWRTCRVTGDALTTLAQASG
ncbi:GNAT family N-acetyltransferase [Leptolyngbya sp. CCY15150]|uniref:GNAT family N-acetyltransferase n=1 Tax=Leptolyngbya sp. CCY15150 TaxID=2767772 RepID=UPI00194FFFB6|nr:GNAT family N-acetyltransferase [Leptolyngbya sp. CCY15150]